MRNKQVEFNPYIYTLSKLSRFGYEISIFKYTTGRYSEQPPEQPAHTSRMFLHGKMDVKIFLMFIVAENTGSVNIQHLTLKSTTLTHFLYCKCGYFCWGKMSWKCWQNISCGGIFHDSTPISFIKAYNFYFHVGVIFAKKTKAQKLPPCKNFHIYSTYIDIRVKNQLTQRRKNFLNRLLWRRSLLFPT